MQTAKEEQRETLKNDRRGRRVGSALADYESLCRHGDNRVAQALIARYTRRMDRMHLTSDHQRLPILESLASAPTLHIMLAHCGADPMRPPPAYTGSWPDQLAWGVDSCVAAARLMLCGQVVGAAVVARTQLERWTYMRAANAGLTQAPDEDTADYFARVWSTPDYFDTTALGLDTETEFAPSMRTSVDHEVPHDHIVLSDGDEICAAALWVLLSEVLHGRYAQEGVAWDTQGLLENTPWPDGYMIALGAICDTIRLCLRQLRSAVAQMGEESGDHLMAAILLSALDGFSDPGEETREAVAETSKALWRHRTGAGLDDEVPEEFLPGPGSGPDLPRSPSEILRTGLTTPDMSTLIPLNPQEGLSREVVRDLYRQGELFIRVMKGQLPAGRRYRDDELTTLMFGWTRSRAALQASRALRQERRDLGDDFDVRSLTSRWTSMMLVSEAASLSGGWYPHEEMATAAHLMGSGLRSAGFLWLEDDDRAMSVLRIVLEQCARLRTWRLKPAKAAALEAKGQRTTPRDWIEAAGWRRLTSLNRALGEFAHAMPRSDWTGARDLLSLLQDVDVDPEKAIHTARGAALELLTHMVACETTSAVRTLSPTVANTFTSMFKGVGIDLPFDAEPRFNHIWSHRATRPTGPLVFNSTQSVTTAGWALRRPPG